MSSIADVDKILERTPTELEHNKALEDGIVFQEQLDRLINSSWARIEKILHHLEQYRAGLGEY